MIPPIPTQRDGADASPPTALPVVLVLAAGRGQRYLASGGDSHKLDAVLADATVLEHVCRAVRAAGLPWAVVRPQGAATAGMGDSIAAGVRAHQHASGWLILPGDMPLVDPDTLRQVARQLAHSPVVVPQWQGQPGHPVGFRRDCLDDLLPLHGDQGARAVVQAWRARGQVQALPVDDEGSVLDVDTVADLARVQALWNSNPPMRPAAEPPRQRSLR